VDELHALVRRMWLRPLPFRRRSAGTTGQIGEKGPARWQVSQLHLAVDVAHAPLELKQADRYVSRFRSQAVYQAVKAEVEQPLHAVEGEGGGDGGNDKLRAPLVMDWDALYEDGGWAYATRGGADGGSCHDGVALRPADFRHDLLAGRRRLDGHVRQAAPELALRQAPHGAALAGGRLAARGTGHPT